MDIYVGSIPFKLTEAGLKEVFEKYGEVSSVKIIIDKSTRQNKGFGFVSMPDETSAGLAIQALNGTELGERKIEVKMAEKTSDLKKQKTKKTSGKDWHKKGGKAKTKVITWG